MGMFDYIKCEVELPDSPPYDFDFQSKSLYNTMAVYTITENGRLVKQRWRRVDLRMGELPHYDHRTLFKKMRRVLHPAFRRVFIDAGQLDIEYHGEITFYDYVGNGEWYTYRARFTDGQLDWIRRVPESRYPEIQ